MAYQSNLLGDFWQSYRQKKLGGAKFTRREAGNLLGPMLEYDARKAEEAGRREQQQNQFNASLSLQERARKDQQLAAAVSGVGQLATLPLGYKVGKDLLGLGTKAAPTVTTTAQGAVAPAVAGTTAQGGALTGGGLTGGALEAEAALAGGAPEAATFAAGTQAAPSLFSTAAPVVGPAVAGAGALYAGGKYVQKRTGLDQVTSTAIAPIVAPTMLVGEGIGKGISAISSMF